MVPPMRRAILLVILAACGSGPDFSVTVQPSCPTCTAGHVRAAATAPRRAFFSPDGPRLAAYSDQSILWLDTTLATVETGTTDIPTKDYVAGPYVGPVASGPDGRAIAAVSGGLKSGFGSTVSLVGLDSGGNPSWHSTAVDASTKPPIWMYAGPDGNPIVVSNTLQGDLTLGSQDYAGWVLIAKLSLADGSVAAVKVHGGSKVNLTSTAIGPDGGVVLAGTLDGTLKLGGTAPDLAGGAAGDVVFVAKLDPNGDGVWADTFTGTGAAYIGSVATDGTHVYASGTYTTSIDFGNGGTQSSTDPLSEFVVALDGSGKHQWSITMPGNIGTPTLAATSAGVLFSGSYFDATSVAGTQVPGATSASGLAAEIVNGSAAWLLTATGAGDHACESIGTVGGHTYVMIDSSNGSVGAHVDFDTVHLDGEQHVLAEVATSGR